MAIAHPGSLLLKSRPAGQGCGHSLHGPGASLARLVYLIWQASDWSHLDGASISNNFLHNAGAD